MGVALRKKLQRLLICTGRLLDTVFKRRLQMKPSWLFLKHSNTTFGLWKRISLFKALISLQCHSSSVIYLRGKWRTTNSDDICWSFKDSLVCRINCINYLFQHERCCECNVNQYGNDRFALLSWGRATREMMGTRGGWTEGGRYPWFQNSFWPYLPG